ncbi:hypothetical protein ACFSUN_00125, partial [Oceanobacillus kapialis]
MYEILTYSHKFCLNITIRDNYQDNGGKKMDQKFKETAIENSNSIVQMWMEEINSIKDGNYTASISDELFESTNRE